MRAVILCMALIAVAGRASADTVAANPGNYESLIASLRPGDTLALAAGTYDELLLRDVQGMPSSWITVTGPASGSPAIIRAVSSNNNTVQLYNCRYLALKNLTVDVRGLYVDALNAKDSISHDILIENCVLQGFPSDDQQIVGISTKATVWNWTIRHNKILQAGTGLYLGNSDGSCPFIAGIIEGNVVENPLGYCMEIKVQNSYSLVPGMPSGPNRTIVRQNVFLKDARPSPDGDRPNLLVGGFPEAGPGSSDLYEIYGNFFYSNPRESLFQGTGRMTIHDNLFVGAGVGQAAVLLTNHDGRTVKLAHLYSNTVYGGSEGIRFAGAASQEDAVVGNLVFAAMPISGAISDLRDNLVDSVANAAQYVKAPSLTLGTMDFYPLPGKGQGASMAFAKFIAAVDYAVAFNGEGKGTFAFRGAYAGEGSNPGWRPTNDFITTSAPPGGGGGAPPPGPNPRPSPVPTTSEAGSGGHSRCGSGSVASSEATWGNIAGAWIVMGLIIGLLKRS